MRFRYLLWPVLAACGLVLATLVYRDHLITEGKKAFDKLECSNCHMAGAAPSLAHVADKYDRKTFVAFLNDPEALYTRMGRKPLNSGYPPMPRLKASQDDVVAISYFLSAQH